MKTFLESPIPYQSKVSHFVKFCSYSDYHSWVSIQKKIISFALDLIAIPDFGAGAMENWGLITYRETSILYDAEETSVAAHQWVAVVVAHELAHQVNKIL